MIKIKRAEMDGLLLERMPAFEYVKKAFEQFKTEADNAKHLKYGSKCDRLGQFCPSLLNHRIFRNYKKGRFLKEKPQSGSYAVYEFDGPNAPKRMRHYNKFGCEMSVYFFERNGYQYAIPFIGESDSDYHCDIYKFLCKDERVMEYYEISRHSLHGETYDYSHLDEGYIECYRFYYLNSAFNNDDSSPESVQFKEWLGSYFEEKGLEVNCDPDSASLDEYCYRIFLQGRKVMYIDEYKIINGELSFSRKIKC
ncbi:MAG: hypothetical protein K2N72_02275 [Oscillospiraceae bacterium]|nr:hypothetical protein [Oscillospiraceae bacterium]